MEGRCPRVRICHACDVADSDTGTEAGAPPIEFYVAFVPAAGEAAGPPIVPVITMRFARTRDIRTWRAAGPPIVPVIMMRFGRTRDDRTWRAGGLAGLLER